MKHFIWIAIFFTSGYATPIPQDGDNQCLSKPTLVKLKDELVLAVRRKDFVKAEEITVKIDQIENEANDLYRGSINLIVGGLDSDRNYDSDAQIVNLTNETSTCHNFPDYPIAIEGATGAIVDGHPIICGGVSEESHHSECYHHSEATNAWTLLTNMSTKRTSSASVPVNGKLLVLGGFDGYGDLATSEYVSPDGDASHPGPDLPGPRRDHCAVKLSNGQVMLLGGNYPNQAKSVIIFNPDTETFDQTLPPLTFIREDAGCATFKSPLHDNREVVLAVGGWNEATAEVLDYTQPNSTWTKIAGLPTDLTDYDEDFEGARAVTSASGKGAIVQYQKHFYELTCEVSGCNWRILPNQLSAGVEGAVMMTLPSEYNAC